MPGGIGNLGACYTWKQECYPVPDPCGDVQHIQAPPPCAPPATWFWIAALAIGIGAAVFGRKGGR